MLIELGGAAVSGTSGERPGEGSIRPAPAADAANSIADYRFDGDA